MSTYTPDPLTALCLACGLCCDGTLFKDVALESTDSSSALAALGLPLKKRRFPQPCTALGADKCCRIYRDRPASCRQFECLLFVNVKDGRISLPVALREVAATRLLSDRVRTLLRSLGEDREQVALSLSFQSLKEKTQGGTRGLDDSAIDAYAELTMAVHELTQSMDAKFYP